MQGKPVFNVPAKTVINFKSHFDKKLLCDGITFTAGSACNFSCSFCYVESMQLKQQEWFKSHGVEYPVNGHEGVVIRTKDAVEIARKQIMSKPEDFRMAKKVIYASPKVDVAGNMELVKETVGICKVILENTNWDIRLLSKSNLLPQVSTLLSNSRIERTINGPWQSHAERVMYGVSTGTLDDGLAHAFERGTAKVSKRIESLHWLQDNGYRTYGMICPSLPQDDYIEFANKMAEAIRADKCEHVWAEVINVRGDSFVKTEKALLDCGFTDEAKRLAIVANNKAAWEEYARLTFLAHARIIPAGKLRFLQYVNNDNRKWWVCSVGAVLL